jgi:DNA-binding LacI/PurR family transcriptional regulator
VTRSARQPSVTLKHIAQVLGLAHTSVSRALNDHPKISAETKQRVRQTAERLGYVANSGARTMRIGTSLLVGLIVPDVQNEFYSAAARTMAEQCAHLGYQLVLGVSEDDPLREEQQVRTLRESRAAGVLIVPCVAPTAQTVELLRQLPTVQFLRANRLLGKVQVLADDLEGTYQATQHLIVLGHRRIGFIGPSPQVSTSVRRLAGYQAALRKHGLPDDEALHCFGVAKPDFGEAALRQLVQMNPTLTAVVVSSSRQLLGALRAVRVLRIEVPRDLSLVCFGDADWLQVCQPPVTTVALPVQKMSERATELLFELVEQGRSGAARHAEPAFATKLIVRGTTARPKAARAPSRRSAESA